MRAGGDCQDPPLNQSALGVFILEENIFLQHFHCEETLAASLLRQQHLYTKKERQYSYLNSKEAASRETLKEAAVCHRSHEPKKYV